MKRHYILLITLLACVFTAPAQSLHTTDAASDYNRGVMMYNDGNYSGCHDVMSALLNRDDAKRYHEEAAYLVAMSLSHRVAERTPDILNDYLQEYPYSLHRNDIYLELANYYYSTMQYEKAVEHYLHIDIDDIKESEQDDMNYHLAFSYVKIDDKERALPIFKSLAQSASPYRNEARYYEGYIYYQNQDYKSARRALQQVQSNSDFGYEAKYLLVHIDFMDNNYAAAIAQSEPLLKDSNNAEHITELHRIVGESHYHLGNDYHAQKSLSTYLERADNPSRNTLYMTGMLAYRNAEYNPAIELLSRVTDTDDEVAQNALLHIGFSYLQMRDTHNAYTTLGQAAQMHHDESLSEIALYNQALCAYESNFSMFDSTLSLFEKFLQEYPRSPYSDDINSRISDLHISSRNYATALQYIDRIKNPSAEVLQLRQQLLYLLGTELFANNKINEAADYFSQAIKAGNHAPEYRARATYWLGECCYRKKAYKEALKCYNEFLRFNITTDHTIATLAHYNVGYCHFEMEEYDKALTSFDRFLKLSNTTSPLRIDAYNRLGDCHFQSKEYTTAERYYGKAVKENGNGSDYALIQQALITGVRKDNSKKASLLLQLIADYPHSEYREEAYNELAGTYILLNLPTEAIDTYNLLMQLYPKSTSARKALLQLGSLYYNRRDTDNAIIAYKSLITQHPASNEARIAAEDLKSIYIELNRVEELSAFMQKQGVNYHRDELDSLSYLAAQRAYINKGDTESLEHYIEKYPKGRYTADAAYYMGNVADAQQAYDKALQYYLLSIERNPDSEFAEGALSRCCELYTERKEYNHAATHYTRWEQIASTPELRQEARVGAMRVNVKLDNHPEVVAIADRLLSGSKLSPELQQEALYNRAKSHLAQGDTVNAYDDLTTLYTDIRTPYGAEAAYLIAQRAYDNNNLEAAEKHANRFIENGTTHTYWLARNFILLADIYLAKGDSYTAQQYLTQLRDNYPGKNDDIATRIEEKLKGMQP